MSGGKLGARKKWSGGAVVSFEMFVNGGFCVGNSGVLVVVGGVAGIRLLSSTSM